MRDLDATVRDCRRDAPGGWLSARAGTGERVSISTCRDAAEGYEQIHVAGRAVRREPALLRRRAPQPSRRAVLHVQAAGDPAAPAGLADWFTERGIHFYLAGVRLPSRLTSARSAREALGAAFADLDAVCARLRLADDIDNVIVTAQGRGALAAAWWSDARTAREASGHRPGGNGADALMLYEPELAVQPALRLAIGCPVLVVTGQSAADRPGGASVRRGLRRRSSGPGPVQLGSHVTWLQLPAPSQAGGPADAGAHEALLAELGRWLSAYLHWPARDQLL